MSNWLPGASSIKGSTIPPPPLPTPPTTLATSGVKPLLTPTQATTAACSAASVAPTSSPFFTSFPSGSRFAASSTNNSSGNNNNNKKKEKWLVTRKTWRYMADAGKLLIPEVLRKGKDLKDYSSEDMIQLDETYQRACDQQQEFVIWEGPLVDPRILLARNRIATGVEVIANTLRARWIYAEDELDEEDEDYLEEEDEEHDGGDAGRTGRSAGRLDGTDSEKLKRKEHLSGEISKSERGARDRFSLKLAKSNNNKYSDQENRGFGAAGGAGGGGGGGGGGGTRSYGGRKSRTKVGPFVAESGTGNKGLRNRRPSSSTSISPPLAPQLMKGARSPRRTGSGRMQSTARMSTFGGFGPSGASYRPSIYGGANFDSRLKRRESSRHGFFPSPYGTGMLPTGSIPDFNFDSSSLSSTFRLMLPVGENPPDGFEKVGHRHLPMGEIPNYNPPTSDSYLQLPSGMLLQELPSAYATEEDRDWYSRRSSSALDSGVLSPISQDELEQLGIYDESQLFNLSRENQEAEDERKHNESGIGSGADSIGATSLKDKKMTVAIQTEPIPHELSILQMEEKKRKEVEEKLAREAEEKAMRESEEMEAAIMGDSVMRYLKMVRRNSKSADHKKADRFRSMNYDPTLRNIKSRYLMSEDQIKGMKNAEQQAGDPLVPLLKKCQTPIDPSPDPGFALRKLSQAASDLSDSIVVDSPLRRYSIALPEEPLMPVTDNERDFLTSLYSGNISDVESGTVPEDYYNYLEAWYRAQKGIHPPTTTSEAVPSEPPGAATTTTSPFTTATATTHSIEDITKSMLTSSGRNKSSQHLEQQDLEKQPFKLRKPVQQPMQHGEQSRPVQLHHVQQKNDSGPDSVKASEHPHLQGHPGSQEQEHTGIYIPVSALQNLRASLPPTLSTSAASSVSNVSKSNNTPSIGKPQSFLSSVISAKPFAGLNTSSANTGRSLAKKLWRPRSKSQSRPSVPGGSVWSPQPNNRWLHISNRVVNLETTNLLMLHEFERVTLQKVALQKLNKSDLGTFRIPKDSGQPQKKASQPVFGVPLGQCVDTPFRKRSTTSDLPNQEELQQNSKGLRNDSSSRTSLGSIAGDSNKNPQDRISSPIHSVGSSDSLNNLDFRRSSLGHSQCSALDTVSMTSMFDRMDDEPLAASPSFPNVPPIVMLCIRHLELYGLRTVGIFRVSSSKKRVRQLREDFDNGGDIVFNEDIAVHDVATLLKEFFRDLPEPLIPKEFQSGLLAINRLSSSHDQALSLQRLIQLLPAVNRDTLFVLLHFLGLVAENADDRTLPDGASESGNKMDLTNLATLFAPNLLHTMNDDAMSSAGVPKSSGFAPAARISNMPAKQTPERMEYISAVRLLIEKRNLLFELPPDELHNLYLYMWEQNPELLDALLRRRCALMGQDWFEDEEDIDLPGDRHIHRSRRESSAGSEGAGSTSSWFRFRDKSEQSDGGNSSTDAPITANRWGFGRKAEKSPNKGGTGPDGKCGTDVTSNKDQGGAQVSSPPPCTASKGAIKKKFGVGKRPSDATTSSSSPVSLSEPPKRNAETGRGIDSVVYSPASSTRGTPSSDMFFGSGNTTPSLATSPPPYMSTYNSPTFSPPLSPPPLIQVNSAVTSSQHLGDPSKDIVLQPVPSEARKSSSSQNFPLSPPPSSSVSESLNGTTRTNDQSTSSEEAHPLLSSSSSGTIKVTSSPPSSSLQSREQKKYVRKRYTDSRHPTTELPDIRLEVPENMSVQYPPIRKQQKQKKSE